MVYFCEGIKNPDHENKSSNNFHRKMAYNIR